MYIFWGANTGSDIENRTEIRQNTYTLLKIILTLQLHSNSDFSLFKNYLLYLTRMEDMRQAYKILVHKRNGEEQRGDLCVDWRIY